MTVSSDNDSESLKSDSSQSVSSQNTVIIQSEISNEVIDWLKSLNLSHYEHLLTKYKSLNVSIYFISDNEIYFNNY